MRNPARSLAITLRSLARQPVVTVPIVLTLALGIGANAALFAYIAAIAWPHVEAPHPERVVWVYTGTAEEPRALTSNPEYRDLARGQSAVVDLQVYSPFGAAVRYGEQTTYAWGQLVSGGYFRFFAARPALGRLLEPGDDRPGAPPVAVVSHLFWQGVLGGDPGIVGRPVQLNGEAFTVVGVAPPRFQGPTLPAAVYLPLAQSDRVTAIPRLERREQRGFLLFGRLAPGVGRAQAQSALDAVARGLEATAPLPDGKRRFLLLGATDFDPEQGGADLFATARILMAAAALFLVLGCASAANLLLARAAARQREWGIRAAVGATRARLAAGALGESVLLGLAGAAAGLPIAMLLVRRIEHYLAVTPGGYGNWGEGVQIVRLDGRVYLFVLGAAIFCSLLASLGPVLRAARRDLLSPLKNQATGSTAAAGGLTARRLLVIAQVALSVLLLVGGGLLVRSLEGAQRADPRLDPDRLLCGTVYLPRQVAEGEGGKAVYRRVLDAARALPGVTAASLAQVPPLTGYARATQAASREVPDRRFPIFYNLVSPDYFTMLGLPILHGRPLDRRDRKGALPAVVINQALARRLWGTDEVLGRHLLVSEPPRPGEAGPDFEVVGVAADVRTVSPTQPPSPYLYFSHEQRTHSRMTVLVRTSAPPRALAPELRRALQAVHPDLALIEVLTGREELERTVVLLHMYAEVAALFGLLGLAVAVAGLFGLLSYSVSLRRRELGIRMALGSRPADVLRLVVREGMALVAAGVLLGVAGALALTRLLGSLLFGVGATDPLTFVTVPLLLAAIALLAAWLPASRAASLDPSLALREV